ncbi:MAG TPA: MarC family protein [bacterium]
MDQLWHASLPLFVALDGVGLLPVFWALSHHLTPRERRRAAAEAVITALLVTLAFLLVSGSVFALMGLTLSDIMIAGGAILIVLCLRDLLLSDKPAPSGIAAPGVVPLGVPLLAGPAVLTTVLLVRDQHGWLLTLIALALNMLIVWVILRYSGTLLRWLGRDGAQVISKIFSLILTAYGVMLIRRGLVAVLG